MVGVAVMGYGVVGSGVVEVFYRNIDIIRKKTNIDDIDIKYILEIRDCAGDPHESKIVRDFAAIENDPEVAVVAEVMGGVTFAYDYTRRCLRAGKSVVTSNKELVAAHGAELLALAKENNANYLFEASVGGGVPIIRPISQCLAANRIDEVCGILNGTTNYILTRMIKGGLSFPEALDEAKKKGYAEADPTADIEGHDACRKICILASLAFGNHLYPKYVRTEGISGITLEDVEYARGAGKVIKLLGRAVMKNDGRVYALVGPHLVDESNPLAGVEDVFNGIVVKGNAIGDVMFYGRGAGKYPTASAVVADIIDAVKHRHARKYFGWDDGGPQTAGDPDSLIYRHYVRLSGSDAGTLRGAIQKAFPEAVFLGRKDAPASEAAFLTAPISGHAVREALEAIEGARVLSLFKVLDG